TSSTPAPNFGRYYIPVLGKYHSSDATADKTVTITPDENNAGKVWVEGLTDQKVYALLKTVPGTYKIPTQKVADKTIQEGTLSYDDAAKQVSVCLGCGFHEGSTDAVVTS